MRAWPFYQTITNGTWSFVAEQWDGVNHTYNCAVDDYKQHSVTVCHSFLCTKQIKIIFSPNLRWKASKKPLKTFSNEAFASSKNRNRSGADVELCDDVKITKLVFSFHLAFKFGVAWMCVRGKQKILDLHKFYKNFQALQEAECRWVWKRRFKAVIRAQRYKNSDCME